MDSVAIHHKGARMSDSPETEVSQTNADEPVASSSSNRYQPMRWRSRADTDGNWRDRSLSTVAARQSVRAQEPAWPSFTNNREVARVRPTWHTLHALLDTG